MKKVSGGIAKLFRKAEDDQHKGAQEEVLQDLFHDMYHHRRRIYHMNFVRGIFFGFGSALGGTVVIAIIIWILSLFVNFPVIGNYFRNAQNSIEQSTTQE